MSANNYESKIAIDIASIVTKTPLKPTHVASIVYLVDREIYIKYGNSLTNDQYEIIGSHVIGKNLMRDLINSDDISEIDDNGNIVAYTYKKISDNLRNFVDAVMIQYGLIKEDGSLNVNTNSLVNIINHLPEYSDKNNPIRKALIDVCD